MQRITDLARQAGQTLAPRQSPEFTPDTESDAGISLPELYDRCFPEATPADWKIAEASLRSVFGSEDDTGKWSDEGKFDIFKALAKDENWSGKRLDAQIKHFLKAHPYPNWKPADIFAVPASRLYGYSWAKERYAEGKGKEMECYRIGATEENPEGTLMYRLADGRVLPFERVMLPLKK